MRTLCCACVTVKHSQVGLDDHLLQFTIYLVECLHHRGFDIADSGDWAGDVGRPASVHGANRKPAGEELTVQLTQINLFACCIITVHASNQVHQRSHEVKGSSLST